MKYKYLLFDADGTLFDYNKSEENALRETFKINRIPFREIYLDKYREINSKLWLDFEKGLIDPAKIKEKRFEELFNQLNLQLDVRKFSEAYLESLSHQNILLEGAEELIKSLSGKFSITVITNGLASVQRRRFENSRLFQFINLVIISEEINFVKPSVEYFDYVIKKLGSPNKNEVLIIGDSLTSDIQGGNNFGIDTCWFNPEKKNNDAGLNITYEIHNLSELIPILKTGL